MNAPILLGAMLLFIALFATKAVRVLKYLKSDGE